VGGCIHGLPWKTGGEGQWEGWEFGGREPTVRGYHSQGKWQPNGSPPRPGSPPYPPTSTQLLEAALRGGVAEADAHCVLDHLVPKVVDLHTEWGGSKGHEREGVGGWGGVHVRVRGRAVASQSVVVGQQPPSPLGRATSTRQPPTHTRDLDAPVQRLPFPRTPGVP
jgi:hypothetical protein